MSKLIVVDGNTNRPEIEMRLPMVIGRRRDSDIIIVHKSVSRQHCELFERDGDLFLRDLGSSNGSFLNDRRVDGEIMVQPGASVRVGPLTFRADYVSGTLVNNATDAADWGLVELDDEASGQLRPAKETPVSPIAPEAAESPQESAEPDDRNILFVEATEKNEDVVDFLSKTISESGVGEDDVEEENESDDA